MGPLWKEIMTNILPIVDSTNHPSSTSGMPPPKLALFSGHDTTLMPILATLGEEVWNGEEWAPYASMIQVEIHEILDSDLKEKDFPSGYAFRLIYNGKVLTSKMDGCDADSELCDSQVLVKQVAPFAKYMERDCVSTAAGETDEGLIGEMESATKSLVDAPGGLTALVALTLSSMMVGALVTWYVMRRQMRQGRQGFRQNSMPIADLSMQVIGEDGEDHFQSEDNQVVDSAVSTNYGAADREEKKHDESFPNNLI